MLKKWDSENKNKLCFSLIIIKNAPIQILFPTWSMTYREKKIQESLVPTLRPYL